MENGGARQGRERVEQESSGAGEGPGEKETGRLGEGDVGREAEAGIWLIGRGDGGESGAVEDKGMGGGEIRNKMI